MNVLRDRDVLSGALLAALGIFILKTALQWTYMSPDGPGPGFFPLWYGIAMIALSLYLVIKSIAKPDPCALSDFNWPGVGRALGTWVAFAVAVLAMDTIGFQASLGFLTFLMVWPILGKSLPVALATAILLPAGFWAVFSFALGINLPAGTIWKPLLKLWGMG
jgi:putative tricarboxylic transport membrane protein